MIWRSFRHIAFISVETSEQHCCNMPYQQRSTTKKYQSLFRCSSLLFFYFYISLSHSLCRSFFGLLLLLWLLSLLILFLPSFVVCDCFGRAFVRCFMCAVSVWYRIYVNVWINYKRTNLTKGEKADTIHTDARIYALKCTSLYDKHLNLIPFLKLNKMNISQFLSALVGPNDSISVEFRLTGDHCMRACMHVYTFWKLEKLWENHDQNTKKHVVHIFHLYHLKKRFFIFLMVSFRVIAGQRHRHRPNVPVQTNDQIRTMSHINVCHL